jgi:transcriptional regulator with GAF, ATPase, and Fis domain
MQCRAGRVCRHRVSSLLCAPGGAEAARMLNIHRQLLYSKMKRYGLDVPEDGTVEVGEADV